MRRGWLLVAGLIAIAVVGTVIATRISPGSKVEGGAMASYMPPRDAAVLYVDVAAIRSAGILEKLASSKVAEEAEYKAFLDQSGFDYKRDLDRLMANSAGDTHYFILQGRFDWDRLKNYAKGQGGVCDGDFCSVKGSTPNRMVSFYPIDKNLMALASSPSDKAAREISRRTPVKPAYTAPNQPVWLLIPSAVLQNQRDLPSGTRLFTRALENSASVMFSLGPQAGRFELTMDVTCRSTEDAVVMKNQLEGVTQLLQSFIRREKQTPSANDLSGVLTSGSFQRESEHVIGRWPIEKGFIESLGGS